ncbi:MAG: DUF433 domain-containing protein [Planctomycetes bacterium]|nr:DUF433 domain-containing protein [Planctomycetota bacterium]
MIRFTRQLPTLDSGVYRLADVARYTELHANRVRSWFKQPQADNKAPLFYGDYGIIEHQTAVSFLDMIDVLVAGQFRNEGVSLGVVRKAYASLQKRLECEHPFCHQDLYTDGRTIFVLAASEIGDKTLSEIVTRQQFFMQIKDQLMRIDYGKATRIAEKWRIVDGVVIDPRICTGKPVVESTGITTFVISNCYFANQEDAAIVSELFNISESHVLSAVNFEQVYGRTRAA